MLQLATSTWMPIALGVGLAALVLLVLVGTTARRPPPDDADQTPPDSGNGWGGARRPPRPPPVGPISWCDFELEFAAYVTGRSGHAVDARGAARSPGDPRRVADGPTGMTRRR